MGDAAVEGVSETGSAREIISQLEQQYMRLLRSRIADLESQLATAKEEKAPVEDKPAADTTNNTAAATTTKEDSTSSPAEKEKEADIAGTNDKPTEKDELRYVILISSWDSSRLEYVDTPADIKNEKDTIGPQPKSNKSFTLKKLHDNHVLEGSNVSVEFEPLAKLLGKITMKWGYPEDATSLVSPYSGLIWSWEEALTESQRIVENKDDQQARVDLKELLRLLSTSSGDEKVDRYFKDRPTFLKEKSITFESLWSLFPPGTLIVAKPVLGQLQIFCVENYSSGRDFYLNCFCLDWNGFEFNRVPFEVKIPNWGDHRKSINELPYYPLEYYKEPDMTPEESRQQLESRLIQRGKKYRDFCITERGRQMFNYDGNMYFDRSAGSFHHRSSADNNNNDDGNDDDSASISASRASGASLGAPDTRKQVKGAVMIDFGSFFEYQPPRSSIMGPLRIHGDLEYISPERRKNEVFKNMYHFDWDGHSRDKPMTDTQYMLCPPRLLGYALKQRIWGQFLIENLSAPDERDSRTFNEKLQLDRETKTLIQNSVMAHEQGKRKDRSGRVVGLEDFAPGKGRGLTIMLYGMPGVGKTLTAESVALMAGKPLLSVGVSDIGIEGEKVEQNLQRVFDLAGLWEAVLLFDEADVFLEARGEGENDLRRNAMVSVLLRVLEYYDGILILTTNRMRSFDIAVQSRIHLAIKYEELLGDQRESIFLSFIDQLKSKNQVDEYNAITQWVRKEGSRRYTFNGRQIRNIVSTAHGIAISEGRKLMREDLASVAGLTDDFKRDLYSQEVVFNDRQMNARR